MSQILQPNPNVVEPLPDTAILPANGSNRRRRLLLWTISCSVLLLASAGVRAFQSRYYQEENSYNVESPFALKYIPKQVGTWHMIEGSEGSLDPLTTRITGSTDHILASYRDDQTGLRLQVMLLYGPAEPVLPHIPEVCYPSTGFKSGGPAIDRSIEIANNPDLKPQFRSTLFTKSSGRDVIRETAYYGFRHDSEWVPWVITKNSPRKNPGIFKLQISRRMTPTENRFQEEPVEEFLKQIIPELEKMINAAAAKEAKVAKSAT